MTGLKIPSPFSWSRRAISLDKGRGEIRKPIASTRFPSQHSCSARALPSVWEREAECIPTWSTHFSRALLSHNGFKPSNMQAVALGGWTCPNCALDPLFSVCLHNCTDAFQRETLFLESGTGHSRVGPLHANVCFALGLFGERRVFHIGCIFCPSVVSLAEFFLFNRCTASSHHAADRNSRVSFFTSWFIFTTVHEMDTHKLVSFSVSSWRAGYRAVFSIQDIFVIVAGFSRGVSS